MQNLQKLNNTQERLVRCYFSQPERQISLDAGEILMKQDDENYRLYYVLSGHITATVRVENEIDEDDEKDNEDELEQVAIFYADAGTYLGVHSFFSYTSASSTTLTATKRSELAWIDVNTRPIELDVYGSLNEQFMMVIVDELSQRHMRLGQMATEREQALKHLLEAEKLSALGKIAAGISHELNNAISVISSTSKRLYKFLQQEVNMTEPELVNWFEKGSKDGQQVNSSDIRQKYRDVMAKYRLDAQQAKTIVRIFGNKPINELPKDLDRAIALWESGRDCHDMILASTHAKNIVSSVKQLGGGNYQREEGIDINLTIREVLVLLKSELRSVDVQLNLAEIPLLVGSPTELVQIWLNIVKNACDAMKEAGTANAEINIVSSHNGRTVRVAISNNGPPVPESLKAQIFQPQFTTKRSTNCVGLGLGLYIVKRLIESYGGKIVLQSNLERTCFTVILPLKAA